MSELSPVPPASGADRAAVLMMLLTEDDAARLLGQLSQEELRTLGTRMCTLGEVGPGAIADAIASFAQSAAQPGISAHGRVENVHRMMTGALGDLKAKSLMKSVAPEHTPSRTPALDLVRWLDVDVLIPLIEDEPPQAIAVLLLQLESSVAAQVLAGLPEELHTPVVHRIARLGNVSEQAIAILEQTLSAKIARVHGMAAHKMGGVREAAGIINSAARSVEKRVMPAIGKLDKQLHRELEGELFKFEHLYVLDAKMMGQLLREIESEVLIDALKGIAEEEREHFFSAMSARAAEGVKDEIEARGRLKRADVEAAQKQVIAIAKRLAAEGLIVLGDGDDDFV